ncbi:hypothetical protein GT354_32905 [Streptomyces sp. SID3343]|nr:hypothetical protein [Streptomyces sp. SID3343]
MYLVHVTLFDPTNQPSDRINITRLKCLIMQNSSKIDVEHVVVHEQGSSVTVGLFVISPNLADAESAALAACRAALSNAPEFADHRIMRCEVPLFPGLRDDPFQGF